MYQCLVSSMDSKPVHNTPDAASPYNLSTTSCSLLTIVLLIIPSILFALFAASTHCLDGFAQLCIITPRSLSSSEALKATPPYVIFELFVASSHVHYREFVYVEEHLPVLGPLIQSSKIFSQYGRIFLGDHILAQFRVIRKL